MAETIVDLEDRWFHPKWTAFNQPGDQLHAALLLHALLLHAAMLYLL